MLSSLRRLALNGQEAPNDDNSIGIGIDLGTTFSAVAFLDDNGNNDNCTPTIIPIPENGRTLPSVVALLSQEETSSQANDQANVKEYKILVGKGACAYEVQKQDKDNIVPNVYRNVKRIIGTGGKLAASDIAEVVPNLIVNPLGKTYKKESLLNSLHDAEHHPTLLHYRSDDKTNEKSVSCTTKVRPEFISSCILSLHKTERVTSCHWHTSLL